MVSRKTKMAGWPWRKLLAYMMVVALAFAVIGAVWAAKIPQVNAADITWAEYPSNPVYDPAVPAEKAYYPCVLYDTNQFSGRGASNYYKMWYSDGQGQYEAVTYSDDGVNWSAPVQTTGIKAAGYHAKILYVPGGYGAGPYYYKIWYWDSSVADVPYTIDGIRTADSSDGVAWTNDTVITQNAGAQLVTGVWPDWNRGTYGPVSIHYNPSATNTGANPFDYTFAMYYDGTTGGVESIGLGYSADGNTDWRIYGSTPVLDHGVSGDWDSDYATAGTVIEGDDGTWRMWYSGSGPSGGGNQGIGYATSTDGLSWTKDPGNPLYSIYQGVAWRNARCYTPSVLYSSTRFDTHGTQTHYKMWFTGEASATGNRTIGYAYQPEPVIGLQKSADPSGMVRRGDTITYTLTAGNTGIGAATGCSITDAIPANTDYVADSTTLNGSPVADVGGTSPLAGGMAVNSSGQPAGTIAVGANAIVTFQVVVQNSLPFGTSVSNSATLASDGQTSVQANYSNSSGTAVIGLQKSNNPPGTIKRGDTITYTLTAGNTGDNVATGCSLTDAIPANTDYVADSTTLNGSGVPDVGGTSPLVGGMAVNSGGKPAGCIADGANAVVTFQVVVKNSLPFSTSVSNSATLASDDLTPVLASCSNGSGTPVIHLFKNADPPGSVRIGQVLTYTIRARNDGTDAAYGCNLTDAIPAYTTYVADSTTLNGNPVSDVGGTTPLVAGMRVNSNGQPAGKIVEGGAPVQAVVTFRVKVENTLPPATPIANVADLLWDGMSSPVQASYNNAGFIGSSFYFAEGYTGTGFAEYLTLGNPNTFAATVDVTYLFPDGSTQPGSYSVPPQSRVTVNVNEVVGAGREVSMQVLSAATNIVAERPMYFDYTNENTVSWTGGHDVMGAAQAGRTWYFAEGYTGPGFDEYVCVLNPGGAKANLTFNFQTEAGLIVKSGYSVGAHSRSTFKVNDVLGPDYQTSLKLESSQPVVAERPMYFDYTGVAERNWTGGHCVMGASSLAKQYYFAEGSTRNSSRDGAFEEWLTLQNPGTSPITVNATYQLGSGQGDNVNRSYVVQPGRRATVLVADQIGAFKDVSVLLTSSSDFLAERPMYFNYNGVWTGGHCVIGSTTSASRWFFAEGYTGQNFDEWLCIQNTGGKEATVQVTYFTQQSGPLSPRTVKVPAHTRATVLVNENAGPGLSLSTQLVSDRPVVVERPMYFNYNGVWTGGHDVVGHRF